MREARIAIIDHPGSYLDRSPTGSGKSTAGVETMRELQARGEKSLTLLPTHRNGQELVEKLAGEGIAATAHPKLTQDTCLNHTEASHVLGLGLSVPDAVCPTCAFREQCLYNAQRKTARQASHLIATQARAAVGGSDGITRLAAGRTHITIEESPIDTFRPSLQVHGGLELVEFIARKAGDNANTAAVRGFCRQIARNAKDFHGWLDGCNEPAEVPLPQPTALWDDNLRRGVHEAMRQAILDIGLTKGVNGEAMRLVLAATAGDLDYLAVSVNQTKAKRGATKLVRTLIGLGRLQLPFSASVVVNDATLSKAECDAVTGSTVHDITPLGTWLQLAHPILQLIPKQDVTIGRNAKRVADLLRGLLHDLPQHERIGLITHQRLAKVLRELVGDEYRKRLAKVDYFRSGLSRASNCWHQECDALIVLGTPRVPPHAIRVRLMQLGRYEAPKLTQQQAGWHLDHWVGTTRSGEEHTIHTGRYADDDWNEAYGYLVRSELVQAIGRGRSLLPDGIPVYVVSREYLGPLAPQALGDIRVVDGLLAPLSTVQSRILRLLRGGVVLKTSDLVKQLAEIGLGVSDRRCRLILRQMERDERVARVGERKGWFAIRPTAKYRNGSLINEY
jgi:hypothetical protein